jgi:protein SCO1/2
VTRRWAVWFAAGAIACGGKGSTPLSPHGFVGQELASPVPKPSFAFTDSRGKPFRFESATADKVTLLLFGYTNCPNECPVHLANLAAVIDRMPEEVQRHLSVVFITTDPARDSLAVLDAWVKGFDPEFIALTASDSVIAAAEQVVRLPPAERAKAGPDGGYTVGHATAVIAYTRDGWGRVAYGFGTRQREWAHDLPLLVDYGEK